MTEVDHQPEPSEAPAASSPHRRSRRPRSARGADSPTSAGEPTEAASSASVNEMVVNAAGNNPAPAGEPINESLSDEEVAELAQLEAVIHQGFDSFAQVGHALSEIRDRRLYRGTHATFEDYVREVFHVSRSYAYKQIQAADIAEQVNDIFPLVNEAQARELRGVPEEHRREVLRAAVAKKAPVTAASIRHAAHELAGRGVHAQPLIDRYQSQVKHLDRAAHCLERLQAEPDFAEHRGAIEHRCASGLSDVIERLSRTRTGLETPPSTKVVEGNDPDR